MSAKIAAGDLYNLTAFSMCAHNGTHIDAPAHFLAEGETVTELPLEKMVGYAYLAFHDGPLSAADAEELLRNATRTVAEKTTSPHEVRSEPLRILLGGESLVTEEAATVLAGAGLALLGVESQSVGPLDAPMAVHKILLSGGTLLLEGLRLSDVPAGLYFLSAAPLALGGADGAPVRALLIGEDL